MVVPWHGSDQIGVAAMNIVTLFPFGPLLGVANSNLPTMCVPAEHSGQCHADTLVLPREENSHE